MPLKIVNIEINPGLKSPDKHKRGITYPKYNIESKYEIFDAAAHFVCLEMLS